MQSNQQIKNDILNDIVRVAGKEGISKTSIYKYNNAGKFSLNYIAKYFGNWNTAISATSDFIINKKNEDIYYEDTKTYSKYKKGIRLETHPYCINQKFPRTPASENFGTWTEIDGKKPFDLKQYTAALILKDINAVIIKQRNCNINLSEYKLLGKFTVEEIKKHHHNWTKAVDKLRPFRKKFTDAELIEDMKAIAKGLNCKHLKISDYQKNGITDPSIISKRFGSWKKALELAGLLNHGEVPPEELLNDLKRTAFKQNLEGLTMLQYEKFGKYYVQKYILTFGTWTNAIFQAGLKSYKFSEEELLADLIRVATLTSPENELTAINYQKFGQYAEGTFVYRFGSWKKALIKAELPVKHNLKYTGYPDQDLLNDLKFVASNAEENEITHLYYLKNGKYSLQPFYRRYGSWNNALVKAGLPITPKAKRKTISAHELLSDLRNVASKAEQNKITYPYYSKHGKYKKGLFYKRFGNWNNALIKAGLPNINKKKKQGPSL